MTAPAPPTFSALLERLRARDGGRPLVTFYDHATEERTELSVTTYANWVAKTAGLLQELDLTRGRTVRLDLPTHWLGPVFLGAAWALGLRPAVADPPEAVVCGPRALSRWGSRAASMPVVACSLHPLGLRFAEPVPPGVTDLGLEVWSHPDVLLVADPPAPGDAAVDGLSQRDLLSTAAAGDLVGAGGRLLSTVNPVAPGGWRTFVEPLVRGGSLVLVRHPDPGRHDATYDVERATATTGPWSAGQPTRS